MRNDNGLKLWFTVQTIVCVRAKMLKQDNKAIRKTNILEKPC